MTWKPPEGFDPVLNYRDSETGVPVPGLAQVTVNDSPAYAGMQFNVGEGHQDAPTLPLKHYGKLWHSGWDIPTRWAIDAKNRCFIDNAHGHPLFPVSFEQLLSNCESDEDRRAMQAKLDLPVDRPAWESAALANGWLSPEGVRAVLQDLTAVSAELPTEETFTKLIDDANTIGAIMDGRELTSGHLDIIEQVMAFQESLNIARQALASALRNLPPVKK